MAIFKCKMCGGDLNVNDGMSLCECEYCGTKQTIPNADNEKKVNLFNRANRLRFANEFDKAAGIFENIIAEFSEEAEAYWGLCLCKYGIEYVDDPTTAKKIPTCHRTSYESIFEDNNFDLALEYADSESLQMYRTEAKEIDRLQKSILEIAQNEEPFDIFICYKETDDAGQRTKDSVLAQDTYDALTSKGYKVFFSRITLEDKLGQEFEPYIFSALNSAKVMLAVGTKYEYFNAVWVKNEWKRFLDLMRNDRSKTLIPCYCDIDAYDMPPEFKNLQGQDMSKIGFIQDLLRGVGKILSSDSSVVKETIIQSSTNVSASPLLERAFMFLEDGNWQSADEYCEKVLDMEPKNAQAYLGKLMSELHVKDENSLVQIELNLNNYDNYKKAVKFANGEIKRKLDWLREQTTKKFNEDTYNSAIKKMSELQSNHLIYVYRIIDTYQQAIKLFEGIYDYKDVKSKIKECKNYIYQKGILKMQDGEFDDAIKLFKSIDCYKDTEQLLKECKHGNDVKIIFNSAKSFIKKYHPDMYHLKTALADFERLDKSENLREAFKTEKFIDICNRMIAIQNDIIPLEAEKEKLSMLQFKEKKEVHAKLDTLYNLIGNIQLEI